MVCSCTRLRVPMRSWTCSCARTSSSTAAGCRFRPCSLMWFDVRIQGLSVFGQGPAQAEPVLASHFRLYVHIKPLNPNTADQPLLRLVTSRHEHLQPAVLHTACLYTVLNENAGIDSSPGADAAAVRGAPQVPVRGVLAAGAAVRTERGVSPALGQSVLLFAYQEHSKRTICIPRSPPAKQARSRHASVNWLKLPNLKLVLTANRSAATWNHVLA